MYLIVAPNYHGPWLRSGSTEPTRNKIVRFLISMCRMLINFLSYNISSHSWYRLRLLQIIFLIGFVSYSDLNFDFSDPKYININYICIICRFFAVILINRIMKNLRVQKRIECAWYIKIQKNIKRRKTTQLNTIVYIFLEISRGKGLRSDND